jgi:glycerophosphoryl diester phosphodiesterase
VGRLKPGSRYAETFASQAPQDGLRMPKLEALFDLVKALKADHIRFDIETKMSPLDPEATLAPAEFVQALLAVINRHQMAHRTQIQSFDWRTLRHIKRVQPGIETVCLTTVSASTGRGNVHDVRWTDGLKLEDHGHSVPALVKAAQCDVWAPNFNTLDANARQDARRLGLRVIPWTVNAPEDLERVFSLDPDGIISDYPDRVRALMARRGMPLPVPVP